MPIRAENRDRYPENWRAIVAAVRVRSGDVCEFCGAANGRPNPVTGSRVVLTTAHLNHTPEDNDMENLRHLCQLCHNRHDAATRAAGIRERRHRAAGQHHLPETDG